VREYAILVTHPELYGSYEEFIQKAKTKRLKVGFTGVGSYTHVMDTILEKWANVEFNKVPFVGGGPAMASLMGKHLDATMTIGSTALSLVRGGSIRPLIVMADKRTSQYPQTLVPADLGYDITETPIILYLIGIYGPPGMPPERIKILEQAFAKAMKDPGYKEKVKTMNIDVYPLGSDGFRKILLKEYPTIVKFLEILKKAER
jgi:tripartite-type tricarboxylate transporter receptor subunit TctC